MKQRNEITQQDMETLGQLLTLLRPAPIDAEDTAEENTSATVTKEVSDEPVWLDIRGACKYIHVSKSKFYLLIKEGRVPSHRIGKKIVVRRKVLDELVESGELA